VELFEDADRGRDSKTKDKEIRTGGAEKVRLNIELEKGHLDCWRGHLTLPSEGQEGSPTSETFAEKTARRLKKGGRPTIRFRPRQNDALDAGKREPGHSSKGEHPS